MDEYDDILYRDEETMILKNFNSNKVSEKNYISPESKGGVIASGLNDYVNVDNTSPLEFFRNKMNGKILNKLVSIYNLNSTFTCMINIKNNISNEEIIKRFGKLRFFEQNYSYFSLCNQNNFIINNMEIISKQKLISIKMHIYYNYFEYTSKVLTQKIESYFKDILVSDNTIKVDWYYSNGVNISYLEFEENIDDSFLDEAYPFLGKSISDYVDEYIKSSDSVLLLIGKPGSGKTRFIRYLLKKLSKSFEDEYYKFCYTTDPEVLSNDKIFLDYISSKDSALILEDIDFNLKSRMSGNQFMYKLLTSSDGIIQDNNSKIILSTNLPSTNDIDSALLREGRCFDVIHFRYLSLKESIIFLNKFNINPVENELTKNEYSLAELYRFVNKQSLNKSNQVNKIGFK